MVSLSSFYCIHLYCFSQYQKYLCKILFFAQLVLIYQTILKSQPLMVASHSSYNCNSNFDLWDRGVVLLRDTSSWYAVIEIYSISTQNKHISSIYSATMTWTFEAGCGSAMFYGNPSKKYRVTGQTKKKKTRSTVWF